jgi:ATP-dependent helicase/nuclease subunit A
VERAVLPVTSLQDYVRCPRRYAYAHRLGLAERPALFEPPEPEGPSVADRPGVDRLERGTLLHRLLERLDLSLANTARARPAMGQLLADEGLDPRGDDASELLDWAERFLATPFARRLAAAHPSRIHRELPFVLKLGPAPAEVGPALYLKGQIDLLFEDDDGAAVVIDHKASARPPGGLEGYGFQLDCYALAARELVQEGVPVRTGISFLKEKHPGPDLRPQTLPGALRELEHRLLTQVSELLEHQRTLGDLDWPGQPVDRCEAIGCGYRYRCHPDRL